MVQTPTPAFRSFSVALAIALPLTVVGLDKSGTGPAGAQAQEQRQCAVAPRCPPGATLQCDRGPCMQGGRAVIACVRYTCVGGSGSGSPGSPGSGSAPGSGSLPALPLPKMPKERAAAVSCAARPSCATGLVATCTSRGSCSSSAYVRSRIGCLSYSCTPVVR